MNPASAPWKSVTMAAVFILMMVGIASAEITPHDIKLLGNDSVSGDQFGISTAISNNVVVVGAFADDDNGNNSGSAYLFDATTGNQLFKLLASDGDGGDLFGAQVAIDGDLLVVGARGHDGGAFNGGAAYVFDATTGSQIVKLLPSDVHATDTFGMGVAISNGVVAVGSPQDDDLGSKSGSVYVFNATTGAQTMKLVPDDGEAYAEFGFSVAINDGLLAVGAIGEDTNGASAGAVYLFDLATGAQLDKFTATDGDEGDQLGFFVDLADGLVVAGAMRDDDNGTDAGAAYVFSVATGDQVFKLLASNGDDDDNMGYTVGIDDGLIVVGSPWAFGVGAISGQAYIFDATTGAEVTILQPSDNELNDHFGVSVAIENGSVTAGAFFDGDNGSISGSAYIFNLADAPTPVPQVADASLTLFPNYPNPFNPSTSLQYRLDIAGEVELAIYSVRGNLVRTLVSGWQEADTTHEKIWDGRDAQGRMQSSGIYFAHLRTNDRMAVQKMVLMK